MKNGELKIEKGIPIPETRGRTNGVLTDALFKMDIGDSVLVPDTTTAKMHNNLRSWRLYHGRDHRFSCREVDGGVRVWRIK